MVYEINGNYSANYPKTGVNTTAAKEQSISIDFNFSKSGVNEKSASEIMGFEKSENTVPKRQVNPNDKRPDIDDDMWNWMHGNFSGSDENISNIKQGRSMTRFKLLSDNVEVDKNGNIISKNQESNVLIWKDGQKTKITVSSREHQKNGGEVTRTKVYVVDNKSGKLLSEGSYLDGKGLRYNYNEDGSFTTEQVENNLMRY